MRLARLVLLAAVSILLFPHASRADWHSCGIRLGTGINHQLQPFVMPDGGTGTIVLWDDRSTGHPQPLALRLDQDGNVVPPWPASGVPLCDTLGSHYLVTAISDGEGGAIALMQDFRYGNFDVFAQRVTGSGQIASGWPAFGFPVCAFTGHQYPTALVSDGAGGAIMAWFDQRGGSESRIYANHITSAGQLAGGWSSNGDPVSTMPGEQAFPVAASDGQGGAIIVWFGFQEGSGFDYNIYGQRMSGPGSPQWGADGDTISAEVGTAERDPRVVPDGQGGAIVVWQASGTVDLWARRIASDGHPSPSWPDSVRLCQLPTAETLPVLVAEPDGGAIFAWADTRDTPPAPESKYDIYALRLLGDGTLAPGWTVNGTPISVGSGDVNPSPQIVSDGGAGAYITWNDQRSGVSEDVFVQHILGDGSLPSGWPSNGTPLCTDGLDQILPRITSDGSGALVAAWVTVTSPGNDDVYVGRVLADGTVPALPSVLQISATSRAVTVTWNARSDAFGAMTVERRERDTAWETIGAPASSPSGLAEFRDSTVVAGRSYGYRLAVGGTTTEEAWVDVPLGTVSSLLAAPNPTRGTPMASLSLGTPTTGRLQLFDVRGRLVWERTLEGLEPGAHVLSVAAGIHLSPGHYTLRLMGAGEPKSTPLVIVR